MLKPSDLIKNLNEKQKRAVETTDGPLLLMASAGSGKTRVLTHRIAYIHLVRHVSTDSILALTFTNKAKDEMQNRLDTLLGKQNNHVHVETFHSLCKHILYNVKNFSGYAIANDTLTRNVLERALDLNLNHPANAKDRKYYASLISHYKHQSVLARDASAKKLDGGTIYSKYEQGLFYNHMFDFDDLLMYTSWLFDTFSQILKSYQRKFKYILVDEFQDTDDIQFKIVNQLSAPEHNLFAVGDVNQSIYSWRGAKPEFMIHFPKYFPKHEAKVLIMNRNYRSKKNIVNLAESGIAHNYPDGKRKNKSFTLNDDGAKPEYYRAPDMARELDYIANRAKKMHSKGYRYTPKDMAIICRTQQQAKNVYLGLQERDIPCHKQKDDDFFKNELIKCLISYLYVINDPNNAYSLSIVFSMASQGVGKGSIRKLERYAQRFSGKRKPRIYYAIGHINGCSGLNHKQRRAISRFGKKLKQWRKAVRHHNMSAIIHMLVSQNHITANKRDKPFLFRMFNRAKDFDKHYKSTRQGRVLSFLNDLSLDNQTKTEGQKAKKSIPIMTVHGSKGCEFSAVFIPGLNDDFFPSKRSVDNGKVDEERRLFYVALTRAKERLFLCNASEMAMYKNAKPSHHEETRFVTELDHDYLDEVDNFRSSDKARRVKEMKKKIAVASK